MVHALYVQGKEGHASSGPEKFRAITSGTCASAGYHNIYGGGACREAAEALGHAIAEDFSWLTDVPAIVDGCSVRQGNQLFLNSAAACVEGSVNDWASTGNSTTSCRCSSEQPCLCALEPLPGVRAWPLCQLAFVASWERQRWDTPVRGYRASRACIYNELALQSAGSACSWLLSRPHETRHTFASHNAHTNCPRRWPAHASTCFVICKPGNPFCAAKFHVVKTGTCEASGHLSIYDADDCKEAAMVFTCAINDTYTPYAYSSVVDGCSLRLGHFVYVNPAGTCKAGPSVYGGVPDGAVDCSCSPQQPCICAVSTPSSQDVVSSQASAGSSPGVCRFDMQQRISMLR
eukprot:365179-Chlamydomonas_euryale.AAC.4